MTNAEWDKVAVELQARWPLKPIPDESLAIWGEEMMHLPAEQVLAAVRAFYADGREWCPNGGMILAKALELGRDDPDHGEAWLMVRKAIRLAPDWPAFYAELAERSPAVAEAARRYGFEVQQGYLKAEEGTVRAQFREIYKAVCVAREHDDAYAQIPGAGLRGLERGPRQLGDALRRALPSPAPAELPSAESFPTDADRKAAAIAEKESIRADLQGQLDAGMNPTAHRMATASVGKLDEELAELKGQAAPDAVGDPGAGS